MKNWSMLIILAVVIVIVGIAGVSGYNNVIAYNEDVNGKWAQVENQLQRRADLVPNLVNTVKGYAAHEQQAIEAVADARAKLAGAGGVSEKSEANAELSGALSRLLLVVENYPNLKADQNFRSLQDELAGTENRLAVARKDYNDAVQNFNAKIRMFPTNLFAGFLGFGDRDYFKADEASQKAPQVAF